MSFQRAVPAVVTGGTTKEWVLVIDTQSTADLLYLYNANGWLTHRFTRTGTGTSTNGYFTTYGYDAVGNLTHVSYPAGTASVTNGFDVLNRLTNRLDRLRSTLYSIRYAWQRPASSDRERLVGE